MEATTRVTRTLEAEQRVERRGNWRDRGGSDAAV